MRSLTVGLPSLDISHKWNMWSFVSGIFHSASWFQSSSNVVPCSNTLLLLLEYFTIVVSYSMHIPHFLRPFTFLWIFGLVMPLSCCEMYQYFYLKTYQNMPFIQTWSHLNEFSQNMHVCGHHYCCVVFCKCFLFTDSHK